MPTDRFRGQVVLMPPLEDAISSLKSRSEQLSVSLTEQQCQTIAHYLTELEGYNSHTNLVSDASLEIVALDHVLDSISLVRFVDRLKRAKHSDAAQIRLIDIGCGAGFPGMVLAIVLPYLEVVLVESVGKKAAFLQEFVESSKLSDRVQVLCQRAEVLAHHQRYRGKFHIATARAVGTFDLVAELAFPFLRVGGELLAQKSLSQLEESSRQAAQSLPKLGGAVMEVTALDARVLGKERAVIVAEKQKQTAVCYPRDWAKMKHQPL
jgi:16S rRNA (guanine527-N7)-methyltransferase